MKFKIALSAATALGLLMGGALANGNESHTLQNGNDNVLVVNQTGASNSSAGASGLPVNQDGNSNSAEIIQAGDDHEAGTAGGGILQQSDFNRLVINQADDGNSVLQVTQLGTADVRTIWSNEAYITQTGTENVVSSIWQDSIRGNANTINVNQSGSEQRVGGISVGVDGLIQRGNGNLIDTAQAGSENVIQRVSQENAGAFDVNQAFITQNGSENVVNNVTQVVPVASLGSIVSNPNVIVISQSDNENKVRLAHQHGVGNYANVWQSGSENELYELLQYGDLNEAYVTQTGGDENVWLHQIGNRNYTNIQQSGDGSNARVYIAGNSNEASVFQSGIGNDTTVTITGNFNEGQVTQSNYLNTAGLTVLGDRNYFNVHQSGQRNTTIGYVDGNDNTAYVTQASSGNLANFVQTGNNNFTSISQ